ncbi:MAG: lipid A deacylase LpxR family protein, partial [Sphingobacteriaceae bacterium]
MNFKGSILFSILFLSVLFSSAQQRNYQNELGFQTDNDSYLAQGSDRYYTNGLFIYFRHALQTDTVEQKLFGKTLGFEIGQKMYNPQSAFIPAASYIDRPFAGYLYAGSSLQYLYKNESALKLGVQLGVTGPAALGKQAQQLVHQILSFYAPEGWQYQIRNNIGVNFSGNYDRLVFRSGWFDLAGNAAANLGTTFTGAGVGLTLRFGEFNPLYHSVSTSGLIAKNRVIKEAHRREFFFYLKPGASYVAYDATVQGNLFGLGNVPQEITQKTKPFVLSQELGGNLTAGRWAFNLAAIFKTREVKSMIRAHQWGSATFLYRF